MIKLVSNGGGTLEYFDGNQFTWSANPGGAIHTVTHNKGKRPYYNVCYYQSSGVWKQAPDLYWVSPASYGWHSVDTSTVNKEDFSMWYNPHNADTPARFRLLFLPVNAVW